MGKTEETKEFMELKKAFKKWLLENNKNRKKPRTEGTIDTYSNQYVNGFFELANKVFEKKLGIKVSELNWKGKNASKQEMNKYIVAITGGILADTIDKATKEKKSNYQNFQSSFNSFLVFLSEKKYGICQGTIITAVEKGAKKEIFDKVSKGNSKETIVKNALRDLALKYPKPVQYSQGELKEIFNQRLTTQDRFYEKIFLPITILNKLTNNNYNELNESELPDTKFLFGKRVNDYVLFKDIESVSIYVVDQKVYMKSKKDKKEKLVWTETKNIGDFEPLKTISISDLSLDHNNAVKQQLKNSVDDYPEIKKMTDEIIKSLGADPKDFENYREIEIGGKDISEVISEKGKSEEIYNKIVNKIDKNNLKKDLDKLFKEVGGYTIMHRSYNSSQGGKDNK